METHRRGYVFAFLSTIAVSFYYLFSKFSLRYLDPLTFCIIWFGVGTVYAWVFGVTGLRTRSLAVPPSVLPGLLAMGVLNTVSVVATFMAVDILDPTIASLFARADLVFAILIGVIFLDERFRSLEVAGLIIVVAGVLVMNWHSASGVWHGFLLMMIGASTFAMASAVAKHYIREITPEALTLYRSLLITVFLGIYVVFAGRVGDIVHANRIGAISASVGTFFGTFLCNLFLYHSMRFVDVSKSMVIRQGTPVLVALLSYTLLDTRLSLRQGLGGLIIVVGIVLLVLGIQPQENQRRTALRRPRYLLRRCLNYLRPHHKYHRPRGIGAGGR